MAYCNEYSWNRRFNNDGSMTCWFSVLMFVAEHGNKGVTRKEIIKSVWNKVPEDFTYYYDGLEYNNTFRGWNSKLFACMNEDNIINYNPRTKRWYIGGMGKQIAYDYFIEITND